MSKGSSTLIDRGIATDKIPAKITEATLRQPREDDLAKKELTEFFSNMKQLERELVEAKKPANLKVAEIKSAYHNMEKKGYDPEVLKFMHKRGDKIARKEFRITVNSYRRSIGEQLPLFDVSDIGPKH